MSRNRRIGVSMTGIAQFISKFGLTPLKTWSEEGYQFLKKYDKFLSNFLNIPESIKITSIKPSGTVSLLGGATPGIHFPHSRFYIRRVRIKINSPIIEELKANGYHVEPDIMQSDSTMVVSFPIDIGKGVKTLKETTLWEQISLASFMQKYWADNQVSCTVSFKKNSESKDIKSALDFFQHDLKGISFLPIYDDAGKTPYPQMPYEEIDEIKYKELMKNIKIINISGNLEHSEKQFSNYCDSETCEI
jgi:ribonucleotide reductase alpha subunit